jgi:hypothetical protein
VFIARFEVLMATIADTNLAVRALVGVALLAAVLVAVGALRHLVALFAAPTDNRKAPGCRPAAAVAVAAAAAVLVAGAAPELLRRSLELAACAAGMRPGPHSRGDRLEALRMRWAGIAPRGIEDLDAAATPTIEPAPTVPAGPAASPRVENELEKDPR